MVRKEGVHLFNIHDAHLLYRTNLHSFNVLLKFYFIDKNIFISIYLLRRCGFYVKIKKVIIIQHKRRA